MIALIIKELRCYAHQPKYRRIQLIILCTLAFTLFATAFEQFASSRGRPQIHVGESIYAILIPLFFCVLLGLAVPLQAVESCRIERQSSNWSLLNLTPIGYRKFLFGKLMGALIATSWCVWLAIPLFWLSVYTGGLALYQLLQCGLVFIVGFTLFFLLGSSLTLLGSSIHAISRSYAVVLSLTFIPLITPALAPLIAFPAVLLDLLRMLSPLCALIAIVRSETHVLLGIAPVWAWMVFYHILLSAILFWISCRRLEKRDYSM